MKRSARTVSASYLFQSSPDNVSQSSGSSCHSHPSFTSSVECAALTALPCLCGFLVMLTRMPKGRLEGQLLVDDIPLLTLHHLHVQLTHQQRRHHSSLSQHSQIVGE